MVFKRGGKIGKLFGQCHNVVIPENGSRNGRVLKLLADVDLNKPLIRGTKLMLAEESFWVNFKYEKLPTFCFYCGIVGHQEKNCGQKVEDARKQTIIEDQYGDWLRVQGEWGGKIIVREVNAQKNMGTLEKSIGREGSTLGRTFNVGIGKQPLSPKGNSLDEGESSQGDFTGAVGKDSMLQEKALL